MRLVANLDAEVEWAGAPALPAQVRARISALGTLVRVLGDGGDTLETIEPVDPARMTGAGPRPRLEARGEGEGAGGADAVLAWGATARYPQSGDVAIARRANDRRLAFALAPQPDGAAIVTSLDELAARLPAACAATGAWVAKATICAAGRDRVRRRGAALDAATRARLDRLLARAGALLLEPWLDRTLDLGQPGRVEPDGAIVLAPPHRLVCDDHGGFRGIAIDDAAPLPHAAELATAGRAAGARLRDLGYRGPFVVDAFAHTRGFRAVVELNARLTFGWVARAWAATLGPGELQLGEGPPPAHATPLLLPGAHDATSAWWLSASSRSPAR